MNPPTIDIYWRKPHEPRIARTNVQMAFIPPSKSDARFTIMLRHPRTGNIKLLSMERETAYDLLLKIETSFLDTLRAEPRDEIKIIPII